MTTTAIPMSGASASTASRPSLSVERRYRDDPPKKSSGKSSNRALFVLIGTVFAIAAMGVGSAFVFGKNARPAGVVTSEDRAVPVYAALPPMNFSIPDGRLIHQMRLKVLLEIDSSLKANVVDPVVPRIINAVNMRLATAQVGELTGSAGTRLVKDAVTVAANRELQPIRVRQVLVQEMLMN